MATSDIQRYKEFFEVDENYFPCIDDSAIEAGASWEDTYPHKAFIDLLKNAENMLGGSTKRSLWIHGAYGTGKSKCAYALKKILEVPEEELRTYWNRYEPLKNNQDLLTKILGHKERGILTAYRYASGGITTPRDLYFAIQESVKKALIESGAEYLGENSLKESVISWIEANRDVFDLYLKRPEWEATFSQSNSEEVLNVLKKKEDVKSLMDNIFKLASKEGITAMTLDGDSLKNWLKDIINGNNTKIVLIWDEFSGFFKQNRNSLDEFQKIVALCQEAPFYLVVVTHQTESIINSEDSTWKVVQQRFHFSQITLPDNIAFDLIGHAFNVKSAAEAMWNICADDLNNQLNASRSAVMSAAKISDPKVIKDIMPIHPMAALVLKNIASAFQSNQRSMFDFIKSNNGEDTKAFQYFIEHTGPEDDHPLLTIDLLWDFFYVHGRDNLTSDIRMILDTYPQQQNLREDEARVLKTILIMQAIDKRLGGAIDLLKATDQNLSYAFEGITSGLDVSCKGLAKGLANKGILVQTPIGNNKYAYGAAVLAGDQARIEEFKKSVKQSGTTVKLVNEGKLANALSLTPALRLRYEVNPGQGDLIPVTTVDFTRTINSLKDKTSPWHFIAVIGFAKNDDEAVALKKMIKDAATSGDYDNLVFIDATASILGDDDFESYVDYSAMAQYYQGNNPNASRENQNNATRVLSTTWKNRIYNGAFTVYYDGCREGEKVMGGSAVATTLQTIVTNKHKYVFDFMRGVNENQLKLTQAKNAAKSGITEMTSGVVTNAEKSVLAKVWKVENYWTASETSGENISYIKRGVEELIADAFKNNGQISIGEVLSYLENEFSMPPCNLTAFIAGFILKEYGKEPYRYADVSGNHEVMSPDKLSEMIGNYIGKNPADTFIVKMTAEEKAFYENAETAWGITPDTCSSVSQAASAIKNKMNALKLPVWCLKDVDKAGVYEFVEKYIEIVQKEGAEAHKISLQIGKAALVKENLGEQLKELLTPENCQEGMRSFLEDFEEGELLSIAKRIDAEDRVISDISKLFSVQYSSLWNEEIGKDEIKKLTTEYKFIELSNDVLNERVHSKADIFDKWAEKLKFCMCSYEAIQNEIPELKELLDLLLNIYLRKEILPDQMLSLVSELQSHGETIKEYFDNELKYFRKIYEIYLEDVSDEELPQLKRQALVGIFEKSRTEGNSTVKSIVEEFKKNQIKTKLFGIWKEKTSSKTPEDWSSQHRTPILLMVSSEEFDEAGKAFDVLNRGSANESEIKDALSFIENAKFLDDINSEDKVNSAFIRLLGNYAVILTDYEKVRDALDKISTNAYAWGTHPGITRRIEQLAKAEYESGGSDMVIERINKMSPEDLKANLIKMVKDNINLGIELFDRKE